MCTDGPSDLAHRFEAGRERLRSAELEKRDAYVLAINWIYLFCNTWVLSYSMSWPLAVSQADGWCFFFQRPLMSWLLVLGSVTSAWRTHLVRLQASYLCDPNLNEVRNPNDQICGIFNIWKCMHYLQRRKRLRTSQERLSVWHHQRNRKFNPGLKQQPEWERLFKINGHCASFQTIPATGVESRVSSKEEKQSACPSETVPAENSSETSQLILSTNFCTEPSSCCLKSVPLLCNYKSLWTGVLPSLSIFYFFTWNSLEYGHAAKLALIHVL